MVDVGYVRTSTREQDTTNQIRLLMEKGVREKNIFDDGATSGIVPAKRREGFSRLLKFVDENEVERVYVFELSRLGRTFYETIDLFREFEERGVKVISLSSSESWTQMEDPSIRRLLVSIFSWIAEQEREHLKERTKAGIKRAREEGKHVGRPQRQINWKKFDKLRKEGYNITTIAKLMDVPYTTLYKKYRGRGL